MSILITVLLLLLLAGVGLLIASLVLRRRSAVPPGDIIYSDSEQSPGQTMHSKVLPLVGRPDYLIKKDGFIIPVEVKRGRTPYTPYPSHVAQLYAYCTLVTEQYGIRPPRGIISYPEKSFELLFPEGAEDNLAITIREILQRKQSGFLRQNITNICRSCRENHGS